MSILRACVFLQCGSVRRRGTVGGAQAETLPLIDALTRGSGHALPPSTSLLSMIRKFVCSIDGDSNCSSLKTYVFTQRSRHTSVTAKTVLSKQQTLIQSLLLDTLFLNQLKTAMRLWRNSGDS